LALIQDELELNDGILGKVQDDKDPVAIRMIPETQPSVVSFAMGGRSALPISIVSS
jgi:hypothetical protein